MNGIVDYYETLQVKPDATQEEIEQAYRQAIQQYDPAKLRGLAQELQAIAHQRRNAVEEAYTVLRDPSSRAVYDAGLQADTSQPAAADESATLTPDSDAYEEVDYRPLPPRRSKGGQTARPIAGEPRALSGPRWLVPATLIFLLLASISVATHLLTVEARNAETLTVADMRAIANQSLLPAPVMAEIEDPVILEFLAQQERAIAGLEAQAQGSTNSEDWVKLGDAIFDYLEIIRMQNETGQAYATVAPRWRKAAEAYSQALTFEPDDGRVRADYAVSLLRLAQATGDEEVRQQAVAEAEQALQDAPADPRTVLNAGTVLALDPERKEEGRKLLQALIDQAPASSEATAAREILQMEAP